MLPLLEDERARSDRLILEVLFLLLDRSRAADAERGHGQVLQVWSLRLVQRELYSQIINGFHFLDNAGAVRSEHRIIVIEGITLEFVRALRIAPALEVEDYRFGIEVRAVMELHVRMKLEGVSQAILRDLPAIRQGRLDFRCSRLVLQQ
ncbi:hypothetical protein D3C71_1321370 [compost metagenome]